MNIKFRMVVVAVMLLVMACLVAGCKKGKVDCVSPTKKVIEVGETALLSCTFNKGRTVEWDKNNQNVFFVSTRKVDEILIKGIKEGNSKVVATGRQGTSDVCDVKVKTYIRPLETMQLYVGDSMIITTRSGNILNDESDGFYCDSRMTTKILPVQELYQNGSEINISNAVIIEGSTCVYAKHVGETQIHFNSIDQTIDTGVVVKVLARYPDHIGLLDFDDTQDSVRMKVGSIFVEDYTEGGDLEWTYYTYPNTLLLNIIFDQNYDNDMVKSYGMAYSDEEIKAEVLASIEERYEYETSYQGMKLYYNVDHSVVVGIQTLNNYLLVSVASNSSKGRRDGSSNEIISNMQVLINAMK